MRENSMTKREQNIAKTIQSSSILDCNLETLLLKILWCTFNEVSKDVLFGAATLLMCSGTWAITTTLQTQALNMKKKIVESWWYHQDFQDQMQTGHFPV
jgi:hypothetical protein